MSKEELKLPMHDEPKHPIQVVSRRTGVSADALRAWEKRYGAIAPSRVNGSRRLYSDADIERVRLLSQAVSAGRRISQVAPLSTDELSALIAEDAREEVPRYPRAAGGNGETTQQEPTEAGSEIESCMDAVRQLDLSRLESILLDAQVRMTTPQFLEGLLCPLLHRIGAEWEGGQLRIAHEHLATAALKTLIQPLGSSRLVPPSAPAVVVTTPAGQQHELGAMMASVIASTAGWRPIYLGPNLPSVEIAAATRQAEARAVLLSLVYPRNDPMVTAEVMRLRHLLPDAVEMIVGGEAADSYSRVLEDIGASRVDDLTALRGTLDRLSGRADH
jgi:DNA-binding transcriptional MerR regulator/methylmalonyl-CoA mutase cobalamin-binding subunit